MMELKSTRLVQEFKSRRAQIVRGGLWTESGTCTNTVRAFPTRAMDFKKEIGKRITKMRKQAGLSQSELAKKTVTLSASRIANYEQGLRLPKPPDILILAKALDEDPAYLMCLDDRGDMTSEERNLLRDWKALPEKERKAYSRRISSLALTYKDPVPDERMGKEWKAPAKKPAKT